VGFVPVEEGGHVDIPIHQLNVHAESHRHSSQFSFTQEKSISTNSYNVFLIIICSHQMLEGILVICHVIRDNPSDFPTGIWPRPPEIGRCACAQTVTVTRDYFATQSTLFQMPVEILSVDAWSILGCPIFGVTHFENAG
jgi:hypothetical protein